MLDKKTRAWLTKLFIVLAGVGALNWGLLTLFRFDLVQLFPWLLLQNIIYVGAGIGGLILLWGVVSGKK